MNFRLQIYNKTWRLSRFLELLFVFVNQQFVILDLTIRGRIVNFLNGFSREMVTEAQIMRKNRTFAADSQNRKELIRVL